MMPPTWEQRRTWQEKPPRTPVMYQSWRNLLFAHWKFPPAIIQAALPPGLTVDTFNGYAYVAIVPFYMQNVHPRFLPNVPGISHFLETNLRTYVYDERGIPGVWFYSLDANQWLAVQLARALFKLPYFYSRMNANEQNHPPETTYTLWRWGAEQSTRSLFHYQPTGNPTPASLETLEFFLAERYILFAYDYQNKQLYSGRVHHQPYPLQPVEVSALDTHLLTMARLHPIQKEPFHLLYSAGVDVEVFPLMPAYKQPIYY